MKELPPGIYTAAVTDCKAIALPDSGEKSAVRVTFHITRNSSFRGAQVHQLLRSNADNDMEEKEVKQ